MFRQSKRHAQHWTSTAESGLIIAMTDEKARAAETLRKTMAMLGKDDVSDASLTYLKTLSLPICPEPHLQSDTRRHSGGQLRPRSERPNGESSGDVY
jgi:hypothetical protein